MRNTWSRLALALAVPFGPIPAWGTDTVIVDGTATTVVCSGTTCGETNDYDPGFTGCVMAFGSSIPTPGPDLMFAVIRPPDSILDLRLSPSATWDPALYVTTTADPDTLLADPTTCVVGVDNGFKGSDEVLTGLVNVSTASDTVYVIVDSNFTGSLSCGDFDLEFAFRPRQGDTCNDAFAEGLALDETAVFEGVSCVYADSIDPPACGPGFPTGGAPGRDVAHAVTISGVSPFSIRLTPLDGWDGAILVATDCADVDGSCVESLDEAGAGGEELLPIFPDSADTTYYIFIDSATAAGSADGCGAYRLTVSTDPATPVVPLSWGALKARF
jgi:hypothetical protein